MDDRHAEFLRGPQHRGVRRTSFFDENIGSLWHNAEMSERAKCTWESCFENSGRILWTIDLIWKMPPRQWQNSFVPSQCWTKNRRMGRGEFGGIQICGMHVDIYESCHLQWTHHVQNCGLFKYRYRMEAVNCRYGSLPFLSWKPKFWKPCNTTLQTHAFSSGERCGSWLQQVSTLDM